MSDHLISQRKKLYVKGIKVLFVSSLAIFINVICILEMSKQCESELWQNPLNGFNYLSKNSYDRTDKLAIMFPLQFICNPNRFDMKGNQKDISITCVLPKNEVLELLYIMYWFLSLFNFVITSIDLLTGCIMMLFPSFATYLMNPNDKWLDGLRISNDEIFKNLGVFESSGLVTTFFDLKRNLPRVTFSAILAKMKA